MNDGYLGTLTLKVTSASGIESVTKKELNRLGYGEVPAVRGAFEFKGNIKDVIRCNTFLRTADRVYIKLAEFPANDFDELFEKVKSIPFENFISENGCVIVDGRCVKSKLFAVSACQSIVKKAVSLRLCEKYGINRLPEDGERYALEFRIFEDEAEILLNTSGEGLHKRGYRDLVGIAPIKETLASGLILLSDAYYKNPFADPFCGSGTIAVECAMIFKNIAPNKTRAFDFDNFKGVDNKLRKAVLEEANDLERRDTAVKIFASDIDKKAIKLARRHAERAGVAGDIRFSVSDAGDFYTAEKFGTIVTNPPYGERVYRSDEATECYRSLASAYQKLDRWSAFIITSANGFERAFGKKADRTRNIFNSNKKCTFYYYYAKKER